MLKLDELKRMANKDLHEELSRAELDLLKLRLGVSSRQSTQTANLKLLRKYIARIKTIKHMQKAV